MTSNTRAHPRFAVRTPVWFLSESQHQVGITTNVSVGGILFRSGRELEVGERLAVGFRTNRGAEHQVVAQVVRAFRDRSNGGSRPHMTAVRFDQVLEELPGPPPR